ncbi:MAG: OsmC family protein [Brumimicrobium sp.]|nr:OsmC family protein [Brumimicrobium sp.]
MTKIKVSYLGDLRTSSEHLESGEKIKTDAPKDNNGKGEAFSPTDLLAASYANCMMTIIGIYCEKHDLNFKMCEAEVEKEMKDNPRRIGKLTIKFDLSENDWSEKDRKKIENAAKNCPVAKSISTDVETDISFKYN